jgi:putative ABC transport system permease protein
LVVPLDNNEISDHMLEFKQQLQSNSNVAQVSLMTGEPGGFFDQFAFAAEGQGDKTWMARTEYADFEFVKTIGLRIIAGRNLSAQYPTDSSSAVLINRMAAASLGFTPQQAIGKWIKNEVVDKSPRRIVGVVEDFNYTSLKESIAPLVISPASDRRVAVVRLRSGNLPNDIAMVKQAYAAVAPAYPFEYTFLDQKFDEIYRKDIRQQSILSIFSCLAIMVACLGLFGLASFTAAKRTKEIGVRKVLGSSVQNVVFLLSASVTVAIALLTVGFKAVRAALANPTKSLKSE